MGRLAGAYAARPEGQPGHRTMPGAYEVDTEHAHGRQKAAFGLRAAVGSAAALGDAGEALVGQTSSSGVRLSDCHAFNRRER
ncbi:hypothetical protein C0Z18_18805 [Trinickia dabaoshanensis]|uniref:Uncharacterized protein n=1 Tax=Trinickia dabaoshanensis TaxID=564714 RepID=A0A2N7VL54_9BURK|nr:hypothetical protein C0Z18_18805 [Trinickia dabaoshanensis]